jgi:hypothetical protein
VQGDDDLILSRLSEHRGVSKNWRPFSYRSDADADGWEVDLPGGRQVGLSGRPAKSWNEAGGGLKGARDQLAPFAYRLQRRVITGCRDVQKNDRVSKVRQLQGVTWPDVAV